MKYLFSLLVFSVTYFCLGGAIQSQSFLSLPGYQTETQYPGGRSDSTTDIEHKQTNSPSIDSIPADNRQSPQIDSKVYSTFQATPEVNTTDLDTIHLQLNPVALQTIAILIQNGEYRQALAMIGNISEKTGSVDDDEAFYLKELKQFYLIKIYYHLGNYQQVVTAANQYFMYFSNGENFYRSYYYFAAALFKLGKPLEFTSLVTDEFFSGLTSRESRNLRRYLIEDSIKKHHLLMAFDFLMDSDGNLIQGFESWVGEIINKIDNVEDIETITNEYQNNLIKSYANLRKTQLLIRDGEYNKAQEFITYLFSEENVSAEILDELLQLQDFVNIALNTDYRKIGVILPLSHKSRLFRVLSQQVVDGLEMAIKDFSSPDEHLSLVIKDSARDFSKSNDSEESYATSLSDRIDLVKRQVRELVEDDRVIAILGPLARDTSLAAGEIAEQYKVPVISFSQTENIGKDKPFLFRFQRNRIQEAKYLAEYACDYLQAERFVLFYNEDPTGKGFQIMQAFANIVKEKGGKIVGISRIGRSQVDFKNNYLSMTGGYRVLSEEEQEELEKLDDNIEPIIDFDAMFVPVKTDQLKIIMDFNRSFNADNVWVLTGSDANVQENQILTHTRRLRFVDAFPISSIRTYLQPFFEAHWRLFNFRSNYRPPTDYTIYAYEALEILSRLLNNPRLHNRESLRDAINNLSSFPVLTGDVSVTENGEFEKKLNILRIRGKNTIPIF